jgi:hypothetical protein
MSSLGHLINLSSNTAYSQNSAGGLIYGIGFVRLGIFLVSRANTKKLEQIEKEKWDKGIDSK